MSDNSLLSTPVQVALIGAVQICIVAWINRQTKKEVATKVEAVAAHVEEAKAAIAETKVSMDTLEKNTNSIKDALVKVTGEAEHAKGHMVGLIEGKIAGREELRQEERQSGIDDEGAG